MSRGEDRRTVSVGLNTKMCFIGSRASPVKYKIRMDAPNYGLGKAPKEVKWEGIPYNRQGSPHPARDALDSRRLDSFVVQPRTVHPLLPSALSKQTERVSRARLSQPSP
jgi:hypothetical protein